MGNSSSDKRAYQTFIPLEDPAQEKQQSQDLTHMKNLIKKRSDGVKETIRYNQWGQALGQEGTHLASTRKYVSINIDHWTQVPEEKKPFIWEIILIRVL